MSWVERWVRPALDDSKANGYSRLGASHATLLRGTGPGEQVYEIWEELEACVGHRRCATVRVVLRFIAIVCSLFILGYLLIYPEDRFMYMKWRVCSAAPIMVSLSITRYSCNSRLMAYHQRWSSEQYVIANNYTCEQTEQAAKIQHYHRSNWKSCVNYTERGCPFFTHLNYPKLVQRIVVGKTDETMNSD